MGKTDVVVRSAADLERKYNFASLLGLKKNVEITAQGIQKIENELNSMLNALVINLKDVLDSQGEISLWFYSGKPTTSNEPYTSWTNPNDHIGDIYYDQTTGYVYQWNGVWEVNTSPDLIEAMAITNAETDTSTDHERKVFFDTPTVPYSNGDWWIKEDGSLFICQISKESGTYEEADFIDSKNYTESIAEKIGEEIQVLKGTIAIISENYAKFTDLATGGSTIISGDNIVTGTIKSENYIENTSGTKISLSDGSIDSKNFKVSPDGSIKVTGDIISDNVVLTGGEISCANGTKIDLDAGRVEVVSSDGNANLRVIKNQEVIADVVNILPGSIEVLGGSADKLSIHGSDQILFWNKANGFIAHLQETTTGHDLTLETNSSYSSITPQSITTPLVTQTSLEENKKNFEKLASGLDIVKATDIYKYNLKSENDTDKKHIGFVIGDNYNYSKEITSQNNDGVDTYSMISVAWKAIQELTERVEYLESKVKEG